MTGANNSYNRSQSPIFSETNNIAYLSSGKEKEETSSGRSQGSPDDSDDDFNTSDDEPLSKYVSQKVPENAEDTALMSSDSDTIIMFGQEMPVDLDSDNMNVQQPPKKCKVGCPKGRAKPPACDFTLPTSIQYKNVRRCRRRMPEIRHILQTLGATESTADFTSISL